LYDASSKLIEVLVEGFLKLMAPIRSEEPTVKDTRRRPVGKRAAGGLLLIAIVFVLATLASYYVDSIVEADKIHEPTRTRKRILRCQYSASGSGSTVRRIFIRSMRM
jgi:hypothetical protein